MRRLEADDIKRGSLDGVKKQKKKKKKKKQGEDIRYVEAIVVSAGDEINSLKEGSIILYDRHAGHKVEIEKHTYHVIKIQDVVVVL